MHFLSNKFSPGFPKKKKTYIYKKNVISPNCRPVVFLNTSYILFFINVVYYIFAYFIILAKVITSDKSGFKVYLDCFSNQTVLVTRVSKLQTS